MLSKSTIKLINSLKLKKNRDSLGLFVAEGAKIIEDLSVVFKCKYLISTKETLQKINTNAETILEIKDNEELKKISSLTTPHQALAVFYKPQSNIKTDCIIDRNELTLALDEIQDTGNLGTIIRIADWFGIRKIVCSMNTADAYNTKTVQATMGALANVEITYTDLAKTLRQAHSIGINIYGTFLNGENIYKTEFIKNGIIVMGNEGRGISSEIEKFITQRLTIPNFSNNSHTSESLNVAIATAIVCSEFRRN